MYVSQSISHDATNDVGQTISTEPNADSEGLVLARVEGATDEDECRVDATTGISLYSSRDVMSLRNVFLPCLCCAQEEPDGHELREAVAQDTEEDNDAPEKADRNQQAVQRVLHICTYTAPAIV